MTPFIAFLIGTFGSGFVLAIVFGAFHLEAEEKAYRRGYNDGLYEKGSNQVPEGTDREYGSDV